MPDEAGENAGDFDARWDVAIHDLTDPAPQGMLVQLADELTALRHHVETVQKDVAGLVDRLYAVEVTLGDRLAEYADTVVQLGRGLTTSMTTYREGNERSVTELRRALADSEELLRAVLTRTDDLAVEVTAVRSDLAAETSDDALDVDELRAVVRDAVEPIDARASIDQLSADVATLRDQLKKLATSTSTSTPAPASVDAAMQAEVLTALEGMRAEVERLRKTDAAAATQAETDVERERALAVELEAMREEMAGLKRRIALRAKGGGLDDEQVASLVQQIRAVIATRLPDDEVDRLADALAHRMTQAFEVVPDDEAPPAPKSAPKRTSGPTAKSTTRSTKSPRAR